MANTVFFSWQSDTPTREGRNFVERALRTAVDTIAKDAAVEEAVRDGLEVDKDTKGVPGCPPIFDTILAKIDSAAIFVPDLTFVARSAGGRLTPNPNVLIEYGWALKSLGYCRIIPVMNEAHGSPTNETMPFDMAHLRFPITYHLRDGASETERQAAREQLANELEGALRAVFDSKEYKATLPQPPAPLSFKRREPLNGRARFRSAGKPLGADNVYLLDGAALWLRLMPAHHQDRTWLISTLVDQAKGLAFLPLTSLGPGSIGLVKATDGCGYYPCTGDEKIPAISFVFETGETWAVKVFSPYATQIPFEERKFIRSLETCTDLLQRLGASGPFTWVAGIEGVDGWQLFSERFNGTLGTSMANVIEVEGMHRDGQRPEDSLRPFFDKVYDQCGAPVNLLSR